MNGGEKEKTLNHLESSCGEFNTNGGLWFQAKLIPGESRQDVWFPDTRITNQHDLEQIIVILFYSMRHYSSSISPKETSLHINKHPWISTNNRCQINSSQSISETKEHYIPFLYSTEKKWRINREKRVSPSLDLLKDETSLEGNTLLLLFLILFVVRSINVFLYYSIWCFRILYSVLIR